MTSAISLLANLAVDARLAGKADHAHELDRAAQECRDVMDAAFACTDNATPNPDGSSSYCVNVELFDNLSQAAAVLGGVR